MMTEVRLIPKHDVWLMTLESEGHQPTVDLSFSKKPFWINDVNYLWTDLHRGQVFKALNVRMNFRVLLLIEEMFCLTYSSQSDVRTAIKDIICKLFATSLVFALIFCSVRTWQRKTFLQRDATFCLSSISSWARAFFGTVKYNIFRTRVVILYTDLSKSRRFIRAPFLQQGEPVQ